MFTSNQVEVKHPSSLLPSSSPFRSIPKAFSSPSSSSFRSNMLSVHKDTFSRFPFFPSSPPKSPPASLARPFEVALAAELGKLLPLPESSSLSLSWLGRAARVLAFTLSEAGSLLAHASSSSDREAIAAYLDSNIGLLDACNAVSAEVDRLLRSRLNLRFAIHLLSSSSDGGRIAEKLKRARVSLGEWLASPRRAIKPFAADLVRSLSPAAAARRKLSAVGRAIFAVEAVSFLIAGAVVAALGCRCGVKATPIPSDLAWAKKYEELAEALSHKLVGDGVPVELETAEVTVKNLTDFVDAIGENAGGADAEALRKAVDETEKATRELTEGLDELSNGVNELFHSALGLRNTALQGFRADMERCK